MAQAMAAGMTQNWSFEIQKQLATDLIFERSVYVGIKGDHLHTNIAQVNASIRILRFGTALADDPTSQQARLLLLLLEYLTSWFEPLYGPRAYWRSNNTWLNPSALSAISGHRRSNTVWFLPGEFG